MKSVKEIEKQLPGFNCGACGFRECHGFASALAKNEVSIDNCTVLKQERLKENRTALQKFVHNNKNTEKIEIKGLIDGVGADFALHPLDKEPSCRETLICFSSVPVEKDMIIRYRPLGCPIIHFARVIEINHNLLDVWVIGPGKLLSRKEDATEVGICMVLSFQGTIEGETPKVGQTVKFLPAHCMMGKVHSGIIVQLEDNKTRIDCIDLKVWQHTV
ncbi:(Fe-S)-binding protein [Maribellus maritimus]|uniref:(Fe-S)-binding protein n=1 Tax=Maribellus maritimus TaxID=2870838 RepID=UPI001EEA4943|nr:(Fe-S)-binding protein [Maribellus maritimus]